MPKIMEAIAQHYQTVVQGVKTHFIRIGKGKNTIVFLHGWGGSTNSFFELALELFKKRPDLDIILLDYPGFGLTGNPESEGWTTHQYADWMQEFCDELNLKKPHFYVHSFGGRVLVRALLKNPNLGGKLVFTGAAGIKWPLTFREKCSFFISKRSSKAKKALPQKLQKFIITKIFGARDWGAVAPDLKNTLKKVVEEEDFRDQLPNIKNQSLIFWGANDTITPLKSGKVYAEKLPNNELVVFESGRHGIHYTHKQAIIDKLVEFL